MILITGGAGYLGSMLTTLLLESKQPVRVIDNRMHSQPIGRMANDPNLEFVEADLRDSDALARAVEGVDTVIHLAAIVGDPACARDPELTQAINLGASRDLIRLALERGVKQFVFASTCSNYGRIADNATPATEDHELRPLSLYAETKVSIEKDLLAQRSSSTAFSILRFATLYGVSPRMAGYGFDRMRYE
jgi:nucleoside-diphosphate-sugar epimerase